MEAASPQPAAVAMTIPSTSPIAHPVRQCSVAWSASRLSDVRMCAIGRQLAPEPAGARLRGGGHGDGDAGPVGAGDLQELLALLRGKDASRCDRA